MRRKKIWLNIVFALILVICFGALSTVFQPDNGNNFIIAATSLGVALLALYISLRTFYSIDEVNAISRMDGNVMENPRYRPNVLRAVFRFKQVGFTEASEALMSHIEYPFKNKANQSGAHLADSVQEVADIMVLVPFFIQTSDQKKSSIHIQRVSKLIQTMKHSVENFKEISDGSCKLLDETVNLIDSVFSYQKMTANGKSNPSKLLEIRGSIFINPVSCILYNNYLGLYYLQRAVAILCNHQFGLSLREQIESATVSSSDNKALALIYADKASLSFRKAKDYIGDDNIWRAFVCFNISRAEYMRQLLEKSFGRDIENTWGEFINESIRCWITSNQIILEHFRSQDESNDISWLQQALISQENKVRLSKIVFQMMNLEPLTDHNNNPWVTNYADIIDTPFFKSVPESDPQERTDSLILDIRQHLNAKEVKVK